LIKVQMEESEKETLHTFRVSKAKRKSRDKSETKYLKWCKERADT